MTLNEFLKGIADAIRAKKGTTELINPQNFASEIKSIESGGGSITNGVEYLEVDSTYYVTKAKLYGDVVPTYGFYNYQQLKIIELPSEITTISAYAFNLCKNLTLTELPDNVTKIGGYAFGGCTSLALTELPSGVTKIDAYAFQSCIKLALTELPSSIATIDKYAFQSCTNLKQITFKGKPTSIASTSFSSCTNLTVINVPWAEGEVSGAPWGATNATINYNYVGE